MWRKIKFKNNIKTTRQKSVKESNPANKKCKSLRMEEPKNTLKKGTGSSPLSIEKAAFLILRVKRAFKKKRQQKKDKL